MTRLAVIGAGSWGTALAMVLAPRFHRVTLWAYEADLAERMRENRENDVFLPGFQLSGSVIPTSSLPEALEGAEAVLCVVPSQHVRRVVGGLGGPLDGFGGHPAITPPPPESWSLNGGRKPEIQR